MAKHAINDTTKTYAGLDVSLKETAICIVDEDGTIIIERMIPTEPELIEKFLANMHGIESGPAAARLWREFGHRGLPVVCLDSRHAHRVLSMKRNKNDRNDARGLADSIRIGWYREARVRSVNAQFIRSILLSQQQLLRSRRSLENQIRGNLKALGVITTSIKGRGFMPRVIAVRADQDWPGPTLDPLLPAHTFITEQLKIISATVLETAKQVQDVRRLMTVPGIGPMTALAFKAAIDDPNRFSSSEKVGPYLGLTAKQYQSGDTEWVGGTGKSNDLLLRSYL